MSTTRSPFKRFLKPYYSYKIRFSVVLLDFLDSFFARKLDKIVKICKKHFFFILFFFSGLAFVFKLKEEWIFDKINYRRFRENVKTKLKFETFNV